MVSTVGFSLAAFSVGSADIHYVLLTSNKAMHRVGLAESEAILIETIVAGLKQKSVC